MKSALLAANTSCQRLSQPSHLDCLRPAGWELMGLALLLVYYVLSEEFLGREIYATNNITGPLWLTGALAFGMTQMVRMNPHAIWTALFWFRLSTGVYFGLGSLISVFANPETRAYMEVFFIFDGEDIAKVNVLTAASALVVLTTAYVWLLLGVGRPGGARTVDRAKPATQSNLLPIGVAFYAVGATVKYLVILPYLFGLTQNTLEGLVGAFSGLVLVGIYFLSVWGFEYAQNWLLLIIAPLLIDMAIGVMTFSKSDVMLALIMFLLGMLRRGVTKSRFVIATTAIVFTYVLVTPITNYGRTELSRTRGALSAAAPLGERISIMESYFADGAVAVDNGQIDWALVRLSYVSPAAYAVRLRDNGVPSRSLETLPALFIPRFLWPDKPIITKVGYDFNLAATGNDKSAASPGLFAEAYWNFGWLGIGILMVPLGAILSVMSIFALHVFDRRSWIFFPLVFLGMKMGSRIDGFFVSDVAGTALFAILLYAVLVPLDRLATFIFRRSLSA